MIQDSSKIRVREVGHPRFYALFVHRRGEGVEINIRRKDIDGLTKNAKARRGNSLARLVSEDKRARSRSTFPRRARERK